MGDSPVSECEMLPTCAFFEGKMAELMPHVVRMLKRQYCLGDKTKCARHLVARELGEEAIPIDLAPNMADEARQIIHTARNPSIPPRR
jgi:hypothetical protein